MWLRPELKFVTRDKACVTGGDLVVGENELELERNICCGTKRFIYLDGDYRVQRVCL